MFKWLFGSSASKEVAPRAEQQKRGSFFSTEIESAEPRKASKRVADAWLTITEQFKLALPRPVAFDVDGKQMAVAGDDVGDDVNMGFGSSVPNISDALFGWYSSQSFIGHQMCAILSQQWLIDKACSMAAEDAIRQGYCVESLDGELDAEILRVIGHVDTKLQIIKNMEEFVRKGRIFGIRIAFFKVRSSDPDYYTKPFNIDGVTDGSYEGIVQVDPYWCSPMLDGQAASQPDAMDFYEPTWWLINGTRYHRSHLVIFRHAEVVDILKPTYQYGGVSLPQQIMERIYAAERTANEAPLLAMTKRTTVLKVDVAMAYQNKAKFDERIGEWLAFRDNNQIKISDTSDEMEQFDTSLADLDDVIMSQYQLVSAISRVPSTKLLGTSPKGFGGDGNYEESSYREFLESIQTHKLTPMLSRHHELVGKSVLHKKFPVTIGMELCAVWNPLDSPTAVEESQINLNNAQAGAALVDSGAIDAYDERNRLIADKSSGYSNLEVIERGAPPDNEVE